MSVTTTCIVSILLLVASIAAYRFMARVSPGDEVPRILLATAGAVCWVCFFFSIPVIAQMSLGAIVLGGVGVLFPQEF